MDVDAESQARVDVNSTPAHHDLLWFDDGNVVLATDTLLFRVHKSILSLHSTTFKDMFSLPFISGCRADGARSTEEGGFALMGDEYGGLPLVRMVGDTGHDVAHLLRTVYENGYYERDDDNTDLKVIAALLLLSTKYDFPSVRRNVIKHVSRHYPTTLEEYDSLDEDSRFFRRKRRTCHLTLLPIAFKNNIDVLLPGLLFACCSCHITSVLSQPLVRDSNCLDVLLKGRDTLDIVVRRILKFLLKDLASAIQKAPDNHPQTCQLKPALIDSVSELFVTVDIRKFRPEILKAMILQDICEKCTSRAFVGLQTHRNAIWSRIPVVFGFDPWEVLREKLRELEVSQP